jgi:hypothetical protein
MFMNMQICINMNVFLQIGGYADNMDESVRGWNTANRCVINQACDQSSM